MSHHNFGEVPGIFAAELNSMLLGATGNFPRGKLNDADEGEIRFAVAADVRTQTVLVDFGKPVRSLGMDPEECQGLIDVLQKKLWELRGIT